MDGTKLKRALMVGWMASALLLVVGIGWNSVLAHAACKNVPSRNIEIDYPVPVAVRVMIAVGFYGLIAVAAVYVVLWWKGRREPRE